METLGINTRSDQKKPSISNGEKRLYQFFATNTIFYTEAEKENHAKREKLSKLTADTLTSILDKLDDFKRYPHSVKAYIDLIFTDKANIQEYYSRLAELFTSTNSPKKIEDIYQVLPSFPSVNTNVAKYALASELFKKAKNIFDIDTLDVGNQPLESKAVYPQQFDSQEARERTNKVESNKLILLTEKVLNKNIIRNEKTGEIKIMPVLKEYIEYVFSSEENKLKYYRALEYILTYFKRDLSEPTDNKMDEYSKNALNYLLQELPNKEGGDFTKYMFALNMILTIENELSVKQVNIQSDNDTPAESKNISKNTAVLY